MVELGLPNRYPAAGVLVIGHHGLGGWEWIYRSLSNSLSFARRTLSFARKIGGASMPIPALPWWKSGATITTLTAIVVASVPVTTAVQGWVQKNRELALEDRKQTENIRTSYLERLKVPGEHLRTLRFVIATTNDSPCGLGRAGEEGGGGRIAWAGR